MNRNHTSRTATRKSFLSFGVLSPQDRPEQQMLTVEPRLEQKARRQTMFKVFRLRGYKTKFKETVNEPQ
jgi:hypothetical protein